MDGVYFTTGKRAHSQFESEPVEPKDRSKRLHSGNEREQVMPGADSTVYRILCPGKMIGSVIGKSGKVIKSLRQETKAKIKVADGIPGVDERVIIIFSSPKEHGNNKDKKDKDKGEVETDGSENESLCPSHDA